MREYLELTRRATRQAPIVVASYPGEWAVLDFASAPGSERVWVEGARWNVLRDLEIRNSAAQSVFITGADTEHNTFVNVVSLNSNGSGFQIYRGSSQHFFECLAVFTRRPQVPGDADGFATGGRGGPSSQNRLYRCIAVDAPDDGFDSWEADHTTWIGCWAIRAGIFGGNGNGFKAGPGPGAPNTIWQEVPPPRRRNRAYGALHFNVALDCTAGGFDSNGGMDNEFLHNTAIGSPVAFASYPVSGRTRGVNVLRNNLALGRVVRSGEVLQQRNSWNASTDVTVTRGDFRTLALPRTAEFLGLTGSQAYRMLTVGRYADLARLRASSDAVDAGRLLGVSHAGARPDLGAFEVGF